MRKRDSDRFWSKVDTGSLSECWPWTAGANPYGQFWLGGHNVGAHRFALSQALGRPIVRGVLVLHSCDEPLCCNPTHLREGTHGDNMRDMVGQGRQASGPGDGGPNAKLRWPEVRRIRELHAAGAHTQEEIGRMFGVDRANIHYIVRQKTWREP